MAKQKRMDDGSRRARAARARTAPREETARSWIAVAIVGVLAAIVAGAALPNQLTSDDLVLIQNTERLHGLSHAVEILTLPYWPPPHVADLYRPVSSLLLAAQYSLGGGDPLAFRVVSLLLFVATSVAFYRLASDFVGEAWGTAAASLFAVHPVHVEAVASAVGQGEMIVALLSIQATRWYIRARRSADGTVPLATWVRISAAYFVACFTKEHGLVLPAFLIFAELLAVPARSWGERTRALWPGFVALAAIAAIFLAIRTSILGSVAAPVVNEAFIGQNEVGRVLTMLRVVPEWMRLLVWPQHLRVDYRPPEFPGSTGFGGREALGLGIVVAVIAIAWWARRRAPAVTFGLAAFGIALLPVSNVIVPSAILLAERTLFLPSVWFLLAVAGLLALAVGRFGISNTKLLIPVAAVLVLLGLTRSVVRIEDWRDQPTLLRASVADSPMNWRIWQGYADVLFTAGRMDEAVAASRRAIELAPEKWPVRNNFAAQLHLAGRDAEAVDELRLSLSEHPAQVIALAELPPALIALGRYEEARRLADSVIATAGAPPMMVWMRHVADSALQNNIPAGRIRIGVRTP